jgi:hypothetical protein
MGRRRVLGVIPLFFAPFAPFTLSSLIEAAEGISRVKWRAIALLLFPLLDPRTIGIPDQEEYPK